MGAEENYLDKLLKSVTEPKKSDETEAEEAMSAVEETEEELVSVAEESVEDGPISVEIKITDVIETSDAYEAIEGVDIPKETVAPEAVPIEQTTGEADNDMELNSEEIDGIETPEMPNLEPAEENLAEELNIEGIGEVEIPDAEPTEESADAFHIDDLDSVSEPAASDELSIDDIDAAVSDELNIEDIDLSALDELSIDDIDADILDALKNGELEPLEELTLDEPVSEESTENAGSEEVYVSEESVSEETQEEIAEELKSEEPEAEEADASVTELEMPEELNLEELDPEPSEELRLGELDLEGLGDDIDIPEIPDLEEEAADKPGVDGELEDVLSMLDDDADLAEINDILKKSDSKEPIQDEMMDLLNQMADDEAELVNAGVKDIVEDDGVPLPEMPVVKQMPANPDVPENKEKAKKKKKDNEDKAPGAVGKFFNMLTEDLPGPTEADYAAEDEAKAAKKQEAKDKKEQEKLAKDEEKKAKAEEKAAAKKAKADAAAQKKKEKDAAKAAKAEAKKAKRLAEAVKRAKRIPPKKIAAVAVFGASVLGAVVVSTTILSNQGYINIARKAFYDKDYKSVYLSTYGMELNDSDGLIQARSEVILKMQCWYDSYQNNLKLNRQREALDALLHGIESYDHINAEAEQYGVLSEVDDIKNTILNVLETKYGLSEAQVRELLNYQDALAYTIALNDIITGE